LTAKLKLFWGGDNFFGLIGRGFVNTVGGLIRGNKTMKIRVRGIVFVKNGKMRLFKNFSFGGKIMIEVGVIVKVFVTDVGDSGDIEMTTPKTMLVESMRSDFADDMADASLKTTGKESLNLEWVGAGGVKTGVVDFIVDSGFDGADQTGFVARVNFLAGKKWIRLAKKALGRCQKLFLMVRIRSCGFETIDWENYNKLLIFWAKSNQTGAAVVAPQGEFWGKNMVTIMVISGSWQGMKPIKEAIVMSD